MTGRSQTLPWWRGGGGVKTSENKIHWPCWSVPNSLHQRGLNTRLLLGSPRNLSNHTDRQACTRETLLVKSGKMTGQSQTLPRCSYGNDIETKAERSFDLDFVFDIEAKQPAYSRTCKDRSEANPAYLHLRKIEAKQILFIP